MDTYQEILKNELAEKEKNLALLLDSVANDKAALTATSRDTFIRLLNATPNGVIRNSDVAKRCGRNLPERRCGDHDRQ